MRAAGRIVGRTLTAGSVGTAIGLAGIVATDDPRQRDVTSASILRSTTFEYDDDGMRPALLASASIAANYAGRVALPLVAHAYCGAETCDATQLISHATTGFFVGDLTAQLAAGPTLAEPDPREAIFDVRYP